jgi:hypothetical protein
VSVAAAQALEPLASASLRTRLPHLERALEPATMAQRLRDALLPAGSVASCGRIRAEIGERGCWLQYPLSVRDDSRRTRELLVLGTMFTDGREAEAYERDVLQPLARQGTAPVGGYRACAVLPDIALAVSVFPVHGALPGCVVVTDTDRVANMLAGTPGSPRVVGVELVELRRTRGCVLRYTLTSPEHPVAYGKLAPVIMGDAVHAGLDGLAAAALAQRGGSVCVPRVLAHDSALGFTLVSEIPGHRPDLGDADERARAVDAAALVAATLHACDTQAGPLRTLEDEAERASRAVRLVVRDAPGLAALLAGAIETVRRRSRGTPRQEPRFAHGSFAPSQLMLDGTGVGVLDFDRLCRAEPALDLGRFLAPARVSLAKLGSGGDELAACFLERYAAHAGVSPPLQRVALYEVAALARMAARSWLQMKPSRLRTVLDVLEARLAGAGAAP